MVAEQVSEPLASRCPGIFAVRQRQRAAVASAIWRNTSPIQTPARREKRHENRFAVVPEPGPSSTTRMRAAVNSAAIQSLRRRPSRARRRPHSHQVGNRFFRLVAVS